MINKTKLTLTLALLGLPCAIFAQSGDAMTSLDRNAYGPVAGEREVVIGGSGGSNKDFDDSFGGVNVSLSQFVNDMLSVGIRQSVNYVNPQNGGSAWNGSTRIAVDQHFMAGPIRPFVGLNAGRVYGGSVHDSWTAGVEGGAKFYVKPKTFIFALVEYSWFFDHADDADDSFDDGQFIYSAGIGFNF